MEDVAADGYGLEVFLDGVEIFVANGANGLPKCTAGVAAHALRFYWVLMSCIVFLEILESGACAILGFEKTKGIEWKQEK